MKSKMILYFLFYVFLVSCKDETKKINEINNSNLTVETPKIEAKSKNNEIEEDTLSEINEQRIHKKQLNFDKFKTDEYHFTKKANLDFSSNEGAKYFKTRIIDAYKSNEVDFASYYIGVLFGCGADCIYGYIIDVRDGKIYDLPLGESYSCSYSQDKAICKKNSRLFISNVCKDNEENDEVYYDASVWNESKKVFEKIDEKDITF